MKQFLTCLLALISLGACKKRDEHFEYIPLKQYKYEAVKVKDGATFRIISYSGGPTCTPDETYYYQFIVVEKETSDTLRILTPCQIVENVSDSTQGVFTPYMDEADLVNKALRENGNKGLDEGDKVVVFNKLYKDIETRKFRTAIGTLRFK